MHGSSIAISTAAIFFICLSGCAAEDAVEAHPPRDPVLVASVLPLPIASTAAISAAATRHLASELAEWKRTARRGTLLLHEYGSNRLEPGLSVATRVDLSVTGPLARAVVSQTFQNPGRQWSEAIYVFPLPDDSAVDHLRVVTSTAVLEGRVEEKQEARKTYERAAREGRQAGLVEQERPNVFTTHVANIAPGSEITVEIEYQQTVRVDDGISSIRFPTAITPRYQEFDRGANGVAGFEAAPSAWRHPEVDPGFGAGFGSVDEEGNGRSPRRPGRAGPPSPIDITVDLAPGFDIDAVESPYHDIDVERSGGNRIVRLAAGEFAANRDFELRWAPRPGSEPGAELFGESFDSEHYALLVVTPPDAAAPGYDPQPREIIFVIDTSGSMAGASLFQARSALELALERLRPIDRFNVIEFNDAANPLFASAQPAERWNLEAALEFVGGLNANGGTEILPAVRAALAAGADTAGHLRQIVFLTDGSVSNEAEIVAEVAADIGDSRLFAVGIGAAPNSHFMRRISEVGQGAFTHIGDPAEVADRMDGLFRKLESVLLRDLVLTFPNGEVVEQYPPVLPDLYAGEPITVALRLDSPLERVDLSGRTGDLHWQRDFDASDVQQRQGLHIRWARARIADLMDARLATDDTLELSALRDEVVAVALDHHLVSAYTSLVAVDVTPERHADDPLASQRIASNLPEGMVGEAVFGMAATATSSWLRLCLGLSLMAFGWILRAPRAGGR